MTLLSALQSLASELALEHSVESVDTRTLRVVLRNARGEEKQQSVAFFLRDVADSFEDVAYDRDLRKRMRS